MLAQRFVTSSDYAQRWMVQEREIHGRRSLFYTSDAQWLRVEVYPTRWFELPDEELIRVLTAAFASGQSSDGGQSTAELVEHSTR